MNIISRVNLNLHSPSFAGGLVHAPKNVAVEVPDDVKEHPAFDILVKAGTVVVIKTGGPVPKGQAPGSNSEPQPLEDEDAAGPAISSEEFQKHTPSKESVTKKSHTESKK